MNVNENFQTTVDCETVTKYSVILFVNLGKLIVEHTIKLCKRPLKNRQNKDLNGKW